MLSQVARVPAAPRPCGSVCKAKKGDAQVRWPAGNGNEPSTHLESQWVKKWHQLKGRSACMGGGIGRAENAGVALLMRGPAFLSPILTSTTHAQDSVLTTGATTVATRLLTTCPTSAHPAKGVASGWLGATHADRGRCIAGSPRPQPGSRGGPAGCCSKVGKRLAQPL